MKKAKPQDVLVLLENALSLAKRLGFDTDVERVEATLAKFRSAEQEDDAAWDALLDEGRKQSDRVILMSMEASGQLAATERAAIIDDEVKARAAELKQSGVRNPITQAREEAANRWGHVNGAALNRWLRRKRWLRGDDLKTWLRRNR